MIANDEYRMSGNNNPPNSTASVVLPEAVQPNGLQLH